MTTPRNFPRMGGVYSGPRIQLPRATPENNARQRVSITFYANTTWIAPAGVRVIPRMTGKGSDGQPASGAQDIHYGYRTYQTLHYKQNGGAEQTTAETDLGWTETGATSIPANFCSSHAFDGPDLEYWYCYRYVFEPHDEGDYVGPTTGAAATAFSQVFAGGPSGQPAPVSTFLNIQITVATGYPIVVPAGGYITIEY